MSQEQVVIIIRVADDAATDALAKAAEEAEKLANATKKAGEEGDEAGKKTDRWATVLTGLSSAVDLAKTGLDIFVAGISAAGGAIGGAIDAYREAEQSNRLLSEALARTGLQGEALATAFNDLSAAADNFAARTGFSDEQIGAGLTKFIQLTGQAKVTTDDLSTILGLATRQQIEAADAADLYAKALKGDIGPLIDLIGITKDQETAIDSLKTSEEKAAVAKKLLQDAYKGAAEGANANFLAMTQLQNAATDLQQGIGEVIVESGAFQVVLQPLTKLLTLATGAVTANKVTLQGWILDGLDAAIETVQDLSGVVARNADFIAGLVTAVRLAAGAFRIFVNVVEAVNKIVVGFVAGALTGVVEGLSQLIRLASIAAEELDEDLAMGLRGAAEAAGEVSEKLAGLSLASLESAGADIGDIGQAFTDMGAAIDDTLPMSNKIAGVFGSIGEQAAASRLQVKGLREELGKAAAEQKLPPKPPPAPPADAAKVDEARRKAFEERIAAIRLEALTTEDKRAAAQLALNARLVEIDRDRLTGSQRLLATAEASLEYQKAIADLAKQAAEEALKVAEAEKKAAEDAMKALGERIDQEQALNEAITSRLDAFAAGEQGVNRVAAASARLNDVIGKSIGISQRLNAGLITGAQATQQAIGTAGGAVVTFADQLGASAAAQAGILALFEGAAALASFAVGDIAGGAQHAAAAALYGVVAGSSAASASGTTASAPAVAASAGGGGAGGGISGEDAARRGAQILAEELSARGQDTTPITIINDYRGSINANSPAGQREIFRIADGGARQMGASLMDLTNRRGTR